jgi:3-oxoacyl-[acyl-carrier protein] reductase
MKLSGKTALIPGASRPIGRAIARKLGKEGVKLILPTFDWPESIIEMESEFQDAAFSYLTMSVDLRSEDGVKELIQKASDRFGTIDILVNNIERGGMPIVHGSYDLPQNTDQWDLEIATTLKAKWLLYHHSLPLMISAGEGAVVNISSVSAILGRSGATAPFFNDAYSAANRAVSSFTEEWAREAAPTIRVNELMLGLIRNRHGEETRGWGELNDQEKREISSQCLLQRTGTPEEVATATLFLIRDAVYMTGSILKMDGGVTLGGLKVPPMPDGILKQDHKS